jgi:mono/diheme cytochrome c family protein
MLTAMPKPENSDNPPKGNPVVFSRDGHAKKTERWSRMVRFDEAGWLFPSFMLAAILGVAPALAADPNNGERLARRWCAPCHVVASNQRVPTGEAPPFATLAAKPDFDVAKLAFFLLDPHPKMPDMSLSRMEAADLAAYIGSLK